MATGRALLNYRPLPFSPPLPPCQLAVVALKVAGLLTRTTMARTTTTTTTGRHSRLRIKTSLHLICLRLFLLFTSLKAQRSVAVVVSGVVAVVVAALN